MIPHLGLTLWLCPVYPNHSEGPGVSVALSYRAW